MKQLTIDGVIIAEMDYQLAERLIELAQGSSTGEAVSVTTRPVWKDPFRRWLMREDAELRLLFWVKEPSA